MRRGEGSSGFRLPSRRFHVQAERSMGEARVGEMGRLLRVRLATFDLLITSHPLYV